MSWWKSVAVSAIKVSSPLSMTEFEFKSPSSSLRRKKEWPRIDEEKVGKEEIRKCGETITKTIVKYCLVILSAGSDSTSPSNPNCYKNF